MNIMVDFIYNTVGGREDSCGFHRPVLGVFKHTQLKQEALECESLIRARTWPEYCGGEEGKRV